MRFTRYEKNSQAEADTEAVMDTQVEVDTRVEVVIKTKAHSQTTQMSSNKLRAKSRSCWAREAARQMMRDPREGI